MRQTWLVLLLAVCLLPLGHTVSAQDVHIENLSFTQKGALVYVTYDLVGEEGEEYEVDLQVSMSGGDTFDYQPSNIRGDVGDEVRPGSGKRIEWAVLEDFPSGLQNSQMQFKVTAEESGGGALGWVLGSFLAGSGGTVAGIATGILPCLPIAPGGLCPAGGGGGSDPPSESSGSDPITDPPTPPN